MRTARIERVADGVYAAIAEEGGVATGNAGFVDLGGETLVFDTHVSLAAGRDLRRAAEEHGPRERWCSATGTAITSTAPAPSTRTSWRRREPPS